MQSIPCPACQKDLIIPEKAMDVQLVSGPFATIFTAINQKFKCPNCLQDFVKSLQGIPPEALMMFQIGIVAVKPENGILTPPPPSGLILP